MDSIAADRIGPPAKKYLLKFSESWKIWPSAGNLMIQRVNLQQREHWIDHINQVPKARWPRFARFFHENLMHDEDKQKTGTLV